LLIGFYPAMSVNADEIRPALLDIKEQNTGLFHGLGFAGALSEFGVPQHEVPLALLSTEPSCAISRKCAPAWVFRVY